MKYTQIPVTTFKELVLNAGILVDSFTTGTGAIGNIIGATKGGINFKDTPTFKDFGEDIDNCPKNMLELKHIESREVVLSGTFLTVNATNAKRLVGSATVTAGARTYTLTSDTAIVPGKVYYTQSGTSPNYVYTPVANPVATSLSTYYELTTAAADRVVPNNDITAADFSDIWGIFDYSEKNGPTKGGYLAIHMMNALSTGGFQIQSTDKEKGEFAFEFTGHYSMGAQTTVPYELYILDGTNESA